MQSLSSEVIRAARLTWPRLAELTPPTRDRALYLLYVCWLHQWPAWISSARRDPGEQRRLVAAGLSRTLQSAHLTGHAFDLDVLPQRREDVPQAFWDAVGPLGEALGLTWGGRWPTLRDWGHFELRAA